MSETITLMALDLSGETPTLYLRKADGTLLNTGGDTLTESGSTGVFTATLAESRSGLGTLAVRVCAGTESAANLLYDGWLPEYASLVDIATTPPQNFSLMSIDGSGKLLLQATQTGVTIPTVTTAVNVTNNNDKDGYNLTAAYDAAKTAAQASDIPSASTIATAVRDVPNGSGQAAVGSLGETVLQGMIVAAEASGYAQNIIAKLGAFTGSGVNTVLGFFKALMRYDATTPSDLGGSYVPSTMAVESMSSRIDTINSHTSAAAIRDAVGLGDNNMDTQFAAIYGVAGLIQAKTDNLPSDPADQSLIMAAIDGVPAAVRDVDDSSPASNSLGAVVKEILARIGLFGSSPTTSLLGVLKAMCLSTESSSVIAPFDSSTRSLQAIGAKSEDILQAVEALDVGSGSGIHGVTVTFTASGPIDIQGVTASAYFNDVLVATATSDSNGEAAFNLDDGTYRVRYKVSGYNSGSTTITVSANGQDFPVTLTALNITPSEADFVTGYFVAYKNGVPEPDVTYYVKLITMPDGTGVSINSDPVSFVSDDDGLVNCTNLLPGATYEIMQGSYSRESKTFVADDANFEIDNTIYNKK